MALALLTAAHPAAAQRVWSSPVPVTSGTQPARQPRLAMDGGGNAVSTWIREQASGPTARQTQGARLTVTGLWSHPQNLYTPAATTAVAGESTDVAVNASGRGVAVWVRAVGPAATDLILQAAAVTGASWGPAVNVMPAGGAGVTGPRVGVDSDGNAVAVWLQSLTGVTVVRASRYTAGGTWSMPVTVSPANESVTDGVALGVDGAGNAVAAWVGVTGGVSTLHAAQFNEMANAWSAPDVVGPVGRSPTVVQVALMRAGTAAFVAYRAFDGAHDRVRAARLDTISGTWGAPADLSAAGGDAVDLDIAVDEHGRAIAAWTRFDGTNRIVQTARYSGGWSGAEPRMAGSDARHVSLDTDAGGHAVAVWAACQSAVCRVQGAAYSASTNTWTPATYVSEAGQAVAPQVRLHSDGAAVAVWQDDAGAPTVMSSRYVSTSAPLLQPAAVTGRDVSLSWTAGSAGASAGYTVVASRTAGAAPEIWLPVGNATSLVVTAQPGAYYVRVLALVSGVEVSSNEIEVVVGVGPAPTPPQSFTATANGNIITLTWSEPANVAIAPVVTYYVGAGSAEGVSNLAYFPIGTGLTYVSPPVPDGSYWIRVRAQSLGGVGAPTPDIRVVIGPPPPGAPTLSGGATGPGAVQLQWTAAPTPGVPVTGYELRAGSGPGLSNIAVFALAASQLSFSTTGVPPGVYYVRVVPLSSAGPGTASNELVVTVTP